MGNIYCISGSGGESRLSGCWTDHHRPVWAEH